MIKKFLLVFFSLATSLNAVAKIDYEKLCATALRKNYCGPLERLSSKLISPQGIENLSQAFLRQGTPTCNAFYNRLLDDNKMQFAIVFGYMDGEVGHPSEKNASDYMSGIAVRAMLMRPCPLGSNLVACGFKPSVTRVDTLVKNVFHPSLNQSFEMEVFITFSAYSFDHANNVGPQKHLQERRSQYAKKKFLEAIRNGTDVVLYKGHSRKGGGMDFYPGIRFGNNPAEGNVNYKKYFKNGVGVNFQEILDVMNDVRESEKRLPMVFGSFSCDAEKHFGSNLRYAMPETALILTHAIASGTDLQGGVFASINAFGGLRCKSGIQKSLDLAAVDMPAGRAKFYWAQPAVPVAEPMASILEIPAEPSSQDDPSTTQWHQGAQDRQENSPLTNVDPGT